MPPDAVRQIDGCNGVALYQDMENQSVFLFPERWRSADAHKASGKFLADLLSPIKTAVATAPESRSMRPVVRGR
ncbi:hypothetical protein ASG29_15860 [Sphingomonas sp. Leaf412]|uniref:antibiotic biosynthesis monooxygenase n=1 Tax=Sphingomonas sp. Leaf412 TaxID=1736370 RepID=UPI0006F4EDC2|nr:antibiotic biosynthesis monooxygenase [Sphingomonas sp. Leaf412]KQT31411.1 hypothetical protein ASG29_15860 [Sphingomonas sp. Leaf412]